MISVSKEGTAATTIQLGCSRQKSSVLRDPLVIKVRDNPTINKRDNQLCIMTHSLGMIRITAADKESLHPN